MTLTIIAAAWVAAGCAFVVAEFFVPQFILIFFGAGAILTGIGVLLGLPLRSGIPFGFFAGSSFLLLLATRRTMRRIFRGLTPDVADTEPGFDDFIGHEAKVVSGFDSHPHVGRVEFRGTDWTATAPGSLRAGERVSIVGRDGQSLQVEKFSSS
jgi:membrane protein implicated in regulation of membrane protease activity